MDTLYKYLKLVVPSDFNVIKKEYYINVSKKTALMIEYALSDSYIIKNNYICLTRVDNSIPEYAQKIFGRPALINHGYLAYYTFFNIPEELRD